MKQNIVFVMPPQGSSGAVPLNFLINQYPVFAQFYNSTVNYFKNIKYSDEEIFHNLSSPGESKAITSHPFIFFWSVTLASLYIDLGVVPYAIIGHSLGEFASLVLSGFANYIDMLNFVTQRAQLIDKITNSSEKGAMCHVALASMEVINLISPFENLSIAAINSQNSCVVSGIIKEIKRFEKICDKKGVPHKRLSVPHAAHSTMLKSIDFSVLPFPQKIETNDNNIPIYLSSCITQDQINAKKYPNLQAKNVANFHSAFTDMLLTYETPICIEFAVHSTLKNACLANGAKCHLGASALKHYIPNLSREECFYQAIENNLEKLRRFSK